MANRDIITRGGKGSDLDATDHDQNHKSFAGTVEEQTGTTYSVVYTDQNKTIELNNASMVCTLTAIATIHGQIDTDNFEVTLINTNATAATVNRSSTDTFTGGGTSLTLLQNQSVTLQTDSTGAIWQVKAENNTDSINTTDNNQRIDASGTTETQLFYIGSSGLDNYGRITVESDDGELSLTKYGSASVLTGEASIINESNGGLRVYTGSTPALKATFQHAGGLELETNAPATPTANTLYADSMIKAWAKLTWGGSSYTLTRDFNVSGFSDYTTSVGITLATAITNMAAADGAEYSGFSTPDTGSIGYGGHTYNSTGSEIRCINYVSSTGAFADLDFSFGVLGRQ